MRLSKPADPGLAREVWRVWVAGIAAPESGNGCGIGLVADCGGVSAFPTKASVGDGPCGSGTTDCTGTTSFSSCAESETLDISCSGGKCSSVNWSISSSGKAGISRTSKYSSTSTASSSRRIRLMPSTSIMGALSMMQISRASLSATPFEPTLTKAVSPDIKTSPWVVAVMS